MTDNLYPATQYSENTTDGYEHFTHLLIIHELFTCTLLNRYVTALTLIPLYCKIPEKYFYDLCTLIKMHINMFILKSRYIYTS